jgi:hypothetical protein
VDTLRAVWVYDSARNVAHDCVKKLRCFISSRKLLPNC